VGVGFTATPVPPSLPLGDGEGVIATEGEGEGVMAAKGEELGLGDGEEVFLGEVWRERWLKIDRPPVVKLSAVVNLSN